MKAKRIILISLSVITVLVLVVGTVSAWVLTPGLRPPVQVPEPDYWPTAGWRTSTPEEQGYSSERLAQMLQDIQENGTNIDSLLIIHNGYVALDAHFAPYDGSLPHNLASVTKSVMTTLIAIAAEQGKLDLDKPMVDYFPNRMIANLDERKARMTVRHLTRMVNGMQSGCAEGDMPTIDAMRANPDWVQGALDRPMVAEPGTTFCYDSPGMHILSAILQEATGMTALEFAQQNLFDPLGVQDAIWDIDPQGHNRGWGDLYLTPESAAKIGYLWLHQGNWNGKQIVSREWVLDSVRRHSTKVDHDSGYGNGWWINFSHYFAAGRGGQDIRVIPALNTIVVTTGGGFDMPEIEDYLFPILVRSGKPQPASLKGEAALQATLASIQQKETMPVVSAASEVAKVVSNRTYQCDNNPAGLQLLRMDFSDPMTAKLYQKSFGQGMLWEIGLDGRYRQTADGDAVYGYWADASIFRLEIFDIGTQVYLLKFEGDTLQVIAEDADLTIDCQLLTQ
jgi:CubicO group peptidase (beta-lactamase class C family)